MPLQYDDIPGSWGVYSKAWPSVQFYTKEEADRAFVACTKEHVVPYGSYVVDHWIIRVETEELLVKLKQHLAATTYRTAREVIDLYEAGELPLHCYKEFFNGTFRMESHLRAATCARLAERRATEA